MEAHAIVVVLPAADEAARKVDAFSSRSARPMAILTPNRTNDVYRHRFTAAHELGHLVLHGDATGDSRQEREADAFAAEFLTPAASVTPLLPRRLDLAQLTGFRRVWGVGVDSLIYRCRELGVISDATASRGYQRLRALDGQPGFTPEPVDGFPGEQATLLTQAYELAEREKGLTIS
ncbi:ImmA/IrrE family metallo-endopeptidase [Streptomyces sp. NPDC096097]|uniref:ImmA/IrrE family metallo-endopeptidase n=1 Tax=Streptomyces sp. NPDC096097 TaxID=3155546 RepID=UPI0033237656